MDAGRRAVEADIEISQERARAPSRPEGPVRYRKLRDQPDGYPGLDGKARIEGVWRQRRHAAERDQDAPATVFISYARKDRAAVERLRFELGDLVRDRLVTVWDDAYIGPGDPWEERIADAVLRARVAVLLVSKRFNDSKYIRWTELPMLHRGDPHIEYVWISLDGEMPEDPELREDQGVVRKGGPPTNDSELADLLVVAATAVKQAFAKASGAPPPARTA